MEPEAVSDTPDRRHRSEIVADLVAERKRTYDLERENAALRERSNQYISTIHQLWGRLNPELEYVEGAAIAYGADEIDRLNARIAELEAGNAVLRAERDGYSARLDAAIKLIADILSALPPNAVKAPDGTIYEFDPPPEYAMQMLRAFKSGIDAAILEGK